MKKILRIIFAHIYNWQSRVWNNGDDLFNVLLCLCALLFVIGSYMYFQLTIVVPKLVKYQIMSSECVVLSVISIIIVLFGWLYIDMIRTGRYRKFVALSKFRSKSSAIKGF